MSFGRLALYTAFFAGLFGGGAAHAQCFGPVGTENKDLCQLQDFFRTDNDLKNTYRRLLTNTSPARQAQVQATEQAWVKRRDQNCIIISNGGRRFVDYGCMTAMENAQTAALKVELSAPVVDVGDHGVFAVYGTSMPWLWQTDGLNAAFPFGQQDGTGPIVITFKYLHARPTDTVTVKYIAGQYAMGPGWQPSDANGQTSSWDNSDHASVGLLPGAYMSPRPSHVGALVGTFADATGTIVGTPFSLGDGPTDLIIPQGASQLQLGANDDMLFDNSGSIAVLVTLKTSP